MISRTLRNTTLAACVALFLAAPAAAQSLTSARGLGYPLLPTDARAQVLGGLGIGLQGLTSPLMNPAAAAGVSRKGASISVAAVEQEVSFGGETDRTGATRFPHIQILYPVRGVAVTLGYGGYLDQAWSILRTGEQSFAGDTVRYRDFIGSTGGIGQLQLGVAVPVAPGLAVGAAVGTHTGSQRLQFQRVFDESALGTLESYREARSVTYSGPLAQLGVRWNPVDIVRVAGSLTWAGTLTATPDAGTPEQFGAEYDLPLQVAAGASANLAPSLLATFSGRWSGWSSTGPVVGLAPGAGAASTSLDTWELGGGLEWENASPRALRRYPVRIGGQYRQLPFAFGDGAPTEWFVGGGFGMRIDGSPDSPLTQMDFSVQRGERSAPGDASTAELVEQTWRFTLSVSVFGN